MHSRPVLVERKGNLLAVANKRSEDRYKILGDALATLTVDSFDTPRQIEALDVSPGGIRLSVSAYMPVESRFHLRLSWPEHHLTFSVVGTVRRIDLRGRSNWHVGCALAPAIPEHVFDILSCNGSIDRHRTERVEADIKLFGLWGSMQKPEPVTLRNYSHPGFCILSQRQLELEKPIYLCGRLARQSVASGEPRWQVATHDGYRVGCLFGGRRDFERIEELALGLLSA